jgi:GTPase
MIVILGSAEVAELVEWAAKSLAVLSQPIEIVSCAEASFIDGLKSMEARLRTEGGVVLSVFFDGVAPEAKVCLTSLKAFCAGLSDVSLQALNAKKGQHSLFGNAEAVISSIAKRLPSKAPTPLETLTFELTVDGVNKALDHGHGEILWPLSAPSDVFESSKKALEEIAQKLDCSTWQVNEPRSKGEITGQDVLLRRRVSGRHIELRIAVCGNVDSGKSTLTSVLTHGVNDDGRGSARAKVFVHRHEQETGRTSSVSENHIGFNGTGTALNHAHAAHQVPLAAIASQSTKIVTLYDLAGHEKYLKTTVLGMTRSVPDYACIVISANNGIQRMTKEHLGLCLALKLPFFVVITRIDSTPDNVLQSTIDSVVKLLKASTVKKLPMHITSTDDVLTAAKNLVSDRIAPIFQVSNVTGAGIPLVLRLLELFPSRSKWSLHRESPREMVIDSTFFVTGVGTVVGGIVTQGVFRPNDVLLLGPDGLGNFRPVQIRSIHSKGMEVPEVECGNDAAFCLKKEKRSAIRKGNVMVEPATKPKAYWQFEAEIRILYHSTTISSNYEPVIHSQTVRQSARIVSINAEALRTGDHAVVTFQFLYRPEYIKPDQRIIFREGRTKGIGTVLKVVEGVDGGKAAARPSLTKA